MNRTAAMMTMLGLLLLLPGLTRAQDSEAENAKAVSALVKKLEWGNEEEKAQALSSLGFMKSKARSAVPALINALKDKSAQLRSIAAYTLASVADRSVEKSLLACLGDKEEQVRVAAIFALAKLDLRSEAVLKELMRALETADWNRRRSLLFELRNYGASARATLPRLVSLYEEVIHLKLPDNDPCPWQPVTIHDLVFVFEYIGPKEAQKALKGRLDKLLAANKPGPESKTIKGLRGAIALLKNRSRRPASRPAPRRKFY